MGIPQDLNATYTYGDYLTWDNDQRWEIFDGTPYAMAPAPTRKHQDVSMNLSVLLKNFLKDKPCRVYAAPFDVRFPQGNEADKDVDTVVQPDIVVVCDKNKLDDAGMRGAPDLIIEILSPSSLSRDQIEKRALYEKHGVKEYWIIHPVEKITWIYTLQTDGQYGKPVIVDQEGSADVGILPGLTITMNEVFAEE